MPSIKDTEADVFGSRYKIEIAGKRFAFRQS